MTMADADIDMTVADADTGITVADAAEADVPEILAVLAAAYAPFTTEFRPTALKQSPDAIRRDLSSWLVLRHEGRLTSCVKHYPDNGPHTFSFLATMPGHRRRGHGSALVDEVLRRARARGCQEVQIVLRRTLTRNIAFFEKWGFRRGAPFLPDTHDVYELGLEAHSWAR
ncbi:GNAT family N-acetyltransferase [Streptomyces piniterrae]|uniref:GNAT family N-acetyltransferase n=1 Tax=Streptomyces piniterrae TaxID=2571125 RepID=A0A4U0NWC3_9ACTN|nr:GNAT family N-acetyltransferase [Streptomyces piniterrae]TJZ59013.1 GNAT family N-acetyltransferase [Streptomyces piniterrae]